MTASTHEKYPIEEILKEMDNRSFDAQRELERISRAIVTVEGCLKTQIEQTRLQSHGEIYEYLLKTEQIQLVQSEKFRREWNQLVIHQHIKAEIACYHYFEKLQIKLGRSFESTLKNLRMDLLTQLTLS